MLAVVTVVATVEKGCECCVSAQTGQRIVFAWSGDGKLQQKWGTPRKKQSMLRLMELLPKKRAPADQDLMK